MDSPMFWMIMVLAIIIILFIFWFMAARGKKQQPTDYYALFVIGLVWLAAGIPLKNYPLSAMGGIFTVLGIVNKDKWKERKKWNELSAEEQRLKKAIMIIMGVLVLLGLAFFFWASQV